MIATILAAIALGVTAQPPSLCPSLNAEGKRQLSRLPPPPARIARNPEIPVAIRGACEKLSSGGWTQEQTITALERLWFRGANCIGTDVARSRRQADDKNVTQLWARFCADAGKLGWSQHEELAKVDQRFIEAAACRADNPRLDQPMCAAIRAGKLSAIAAFQRVHRTQVASPRRDRRQTSAASRWWLWVFVGVGLFAAFGFFVVRRSKS